MEKPPVFTPEEIARFRVELAARRAPGAYEPGRWSVSPLNRRTDVTGSPPSSVRLRDATLRSVETLPGVVASTEAKEAFLRRLVGSGVPEVVTAGLGGRDDPSIRAEVDLVKDENPDCRVVCPLMRSAGDIDRAAAAGYDAVQVWVQGFGEASLIYQAPVHDRAWRGEEWRTEDTPRDRAAVLARAARLVEYARGRGLDVVVPLLMVSYATEESHAQSVTVLAEAGATEFTLFDGPGAMSPEAYAHLVRLTRTVAPGVAVGLPPHNTFGLAVGCAVAAVRAGATAVELSVNGYCGGPGNADLAATALAFEALHGVRTGIRTEHLTELARIGEELTSHHTTWNHPAQLPGADPGGQRPYRAVHFTQRPPHTGRQARRGGRRSLTRRGGRRTGPREEGDGRRAAPADRRGVVRAGTRKVVNPWAAPPGFVMIDDRVHDGEL
ncbi:hypothetical protein ABZ915_02430 [Streptomyces sp. NPDC046915]|uniref:hypothetical protein n=1 Tax=Streptomyces sp. NPDC046915 TaxID=3155257 RepID=UPI0033D1C6FA